VFRTWWTAVRTISVAHCCHILLVIGCKLSFVSLKRQYSLCTGTSRTPCIAVVSGIELGGESVRRAQCPPCLTVNLNS
jgi:hypothetical protein